MEVYVAIVIVGFTFGIIIRFLADKLNTLAEANNVLFRKVADLEAQVKELQAPTYKKN